MIQFHAEHTPDWDSFSTVTLSAFINGGDGEGGTARITKTVSVEEARAYAQRIEAACRVVEADRG